MNHVNIQQVLIYTVSQKRVVSNFGENFVNSLPIFKILSLLEREMNCTPQSKKFFSTAAYTCGHSTVWSQTSKSAEIYAEYSTQTCIFVLNASGNNLFNKLLKLLHLLLKVFPFGPHSSSKTTAAAPFVNRTVNNALFNPCKTSNERCFVQFVDIVNTRSLVVNKEFLSNKNTDAIISGFFSFMFLW